MRKGKIMVLCCMVWMLVCATVCTATAEGIVESSIEDDGIVRVYLMSLKDPMELNITLDGVYALDGNTDFRFARGAELTLSACDGNIYLSIGGLTQNMGSEVKLIRHADGNGEGGLYIAETKRDNVYLGDLSVTVGELGLKPILSIGIEDYLYGVLPYEMNDAFPKEALKAQAVAARTYAMQRKSISEGIYDVADTTADQVFRGYTPSVLNAIDAVDATKGIVCVYRGTYAAGFFSASNGGQTAMPKETWGYTEDYGYLDMREDPYDLENPDSMEKSTYIGKNGTGDETLRQMLTEKLREAVTASGIEYEDLRLKEIVSIQPQEPVCEGSMAYTKLNFALTAEATGYQATEGGEEAEAEETQKPEENTGFLHWWSSGTKQKDDAEGWATVEGTYEVVLDVYEEIKNIPGLGMNSMNTELVSVAEDAEGYTIRMRRYGHGVGMSQRGAQWMAQEYGKSYTEILGFYYPNASLERVAWNAPSVTELPELAILEHFVAPTPMPLPELREGEYYATVQVSAGSSLNVRSKPSTEGNILETLSGGRRVIVSEDAGDGWVHIRTATLDGYVKADYLSRD